MSETDLKYTAGEILTAPPLAFAGAIEGPAVEKIAELAREASKPEILYIPSAGLGRGLPERVPVLWDRHAQVVIPLVGHVLAAMPPLERSGTATVTTLASFIDLVNRHKDEGSVVFSKSEWPKPKLTAVIDYHDTKNTARLGKHRIVYPFPVTDEFTTWIDGDSKPMDQVKFAAFIEEHAAELASPFDGEKSLFEPLFKTRFAPPNELIDLSRSLEVFEGAQVKQGVRLQTGERQVIFNTEHTNAAGEKLDIPGLFIVSVAPFLAGDSPVEPVRIIARIRYRISGGNIAWSYQLYRWQDVMRERIQIDLARVGKDTALPVFEGEPEMAA
ncbi:DUF2303 family protein [Xanthobacter autotrophicus]|uniref:DUF2303 family protein n=1 Tax=Xanthobacter autotrophicus TaxID=280 RepID=UPI003728F568